MTLPHLTGCLLVVAGLVGILAGEHASLSFTAFLVGTGTVVAQAFR